MVKTESCNSYKKSGIILALYCVRYPHAMLFLRHKILYYLLKPSKPHHFYGVWNSQCPKFRKILGKNFKLYPFTRLSCPFFVTSHVCP